MAARNLIFQSCLEIRDKYVHQIFFCLVKLAEMRPPWHISNNINTRASQVFIHITSSPIIKSSSECTYYFLTIDSIIILDRNLIDWTSKQMLRFRYLHYIRFFIAILLGDPVKNRLIMTACKKHYISKFLKC